MKCPNCNSNNDKDTIFCKTCGERLKGQASDLNSKNKTADKEEKKSAEKIINDNANIEEDGCTASAWKDIRKSSEWIKKVLLVGLCNIVPIVNFASTGYAQKWGVEAACGKNHELKNGIFEDSSLKTGFFEWVTWVAYGFVFWLASLILNSVLGRIIFIGAILWIALIVLGIFWNAFTSLACMNSAIKDALGKSFEIKIIWNVYKSETKKIICTYFVPSIICKLISMVFCLIIVSIFATNQMGQIINLLANASYMLTSTSALIYAFNFVSKMLLCGILCYVGSAFMTGVEKLIRYRSIGHFINRYTKDWTK